MNLNYEKIKSFMGIYDSYQDETIIPIIDEVAQFMVEAGVNEEIVQADTTCGVIARGTMDLWNYGSGQVTFSPIFNSRVTQLSLKRVKENG